MTDNDLLADGENIVADAAELGGGTLVVRISRTASGTRTWTVGATAPLATVDYNALVAQLRAVDDALATIDSDAGPDRSVTDGETTLTEQLRRSLIMGLLRKEAALLGKIGPNEQVPDSVTPYRDGWVPGPTIVEAIGGSRARVVADLQSLVRAGLIEYAPGGGRGKPSLYRLAVTPARPKLAAVKA